jgi:hypothetical protein
MAREAESKGSKHEEPTTRTAKYPGLVSEIIKRYKTESKKELNTKEQHLCMKFSNKRKP